MDARALEDKACPVGIWRYDALSDSILEDVTRANTSGRVISKSGASQCAVTGPKQGSLVCKSDQTALFETDTKIRIQIALSGSWHSAYEPGGPQEWRITEADLSGLKMKATAFLGDKPIPFPLVNPVSELLKENGVLKFHCDKQATLELEPRTGKLAGRKFVLKKPEAGAQPCSGMVPAGDDAERMVAFLRELSSSSAADRARREALLRRFAPADTRGRAGRFFAQHLSTETFEDYIRRFETELSTLSSERRAASVRRQLERAGQLRGASDIPAVMGIFLGLREAGGVLFGDRPRYLAAPPRLREEMLAYSGVADTFYGAGFDNLATRQGRAIEWGVLPRAFEHGVAYGQDNPEINGEQPIHSVRVPSDEVVIAAFGESGWAHRRFRELAETYGFADDLATLDPLVRNFFIALTFAAPGGTESSPPDGDGRYGVQTLLRYMGDQQMQLGDVLRILEFGDGRSHFRGLRTQRAIQAAVAVTDWEARYHGCDSPPITRGPAQQWFALKRKPHFHARAAHLHRCG